MGLCDIKHYASCSQKHQTNKDLHIHKLNRSEETALMSAFVSQTFHLFCTLFWLVADFLSHICLYYLYLKKCLQIMETCRDHLVESVLFWINVCTLKILSFSSCTGTNWQEIRCHSSCNSTSDKQNRNLFNSPSMLHIIEIDLVKAHV